MHTKREICTIYGVKIICNILLNIIIYLSTLYIYVPSIDESGAFQSDKIN